MKMLKTLYVLLGFLFAVTISAKKLPKVYIPLHGNAFVVLNYSSGTISHIGQLNPVSYWSTYQNTPQNFHSFLNTLELYQLESTSLLVDFDYNLKITGTLNIWNVGSNVPVTKPHIKFEINYDPNTQKNSRRIDYYSYSNAYKSEFIIESVTLTSQSLQGFALYDAVSKIVELNFGIEKTTFSKPVFATVPLLHESCVDNKSNELVLSWNPVDFAEEYELEITFKDNYSDDINTALPPSAILYDFKENSTRIVTKQNYYRIPLVYERGYLLYRIRAVGMGGTDWNKRIPCAWTASSSGNVGQFTHKYGPIPSHVGDKMNWQLSTTYSDEGKRKDVVQYYDGLYMSRQTVTGVSQVKNIFTQNILDNATPNKYKATNLKNKQISNKVPKDKKQFKKIKIPKDNIGIIIKDIIAIPFFPTNCTFYGSDKIKEIIAQEVIYDFNGRPAVQILPVPTGTHKITYIKKLNKNLAGDSYSWKDFDIINNCLLTAHPMSNVVSGNALGAGAYYSPNNPNKLGYNAFIPDSKGYPFSRIQYTLDNTGRTYRQAGVGPVHTLDINPSMPGHETKFYYAKPNQIELDRMFGNEVGYAIRYQKNMVIDPNGQVSVSYLNPEGKTIATALTGIKPNNLLALDNESNPEVTIQVDLFASNVTDTLEHSLTINEQFVVASKAEYKFDYSVRGEKLSYSYCLNNNICLDCIYDLEIKLISNESECIKLFSYSGTFGDLVNPNNPDQLNLNLSCAGASTLTNPNNVDKMFSIVLPVGSYTLVKTLKVNKSAAEAYVKLVFKDTCQSVLDDFLQDEKNKIDTMGCYEDDLSEPMNECDRAKYMMLMDMSPGGQYAQYDITTSGYDASNYPLSVFNPNNSLPGNPNWLNLNLTLPSGTPISDLQTLIFNWDKDTFPDKFLEFHPEYCMLQWCDNENFGKDYDLKLNEAQTYQSAIDAALLSTASTDPAYKQIFDNDPYFHTAPNIGIGNLFLNFLAHPCSGSKTIDDLAKEAAYCRAMPATQGIITDALNALSNNSQGINPPIPNCVIPQGYHTVGHANYHSFGSDVTYADYEWQLIRDMYLTYKEKYLYESRRDYSINNGCFNGCIGVQNFWFFPIPISGTGNMFPNFSGSGNISADGSSWSAEGHIPIDSDDLCGDTRTYYEHKVKRFTNRYDAFSQTTTDNAINLSGVNLYDACATEANINAIQPQIGAVVNQYLCDSINVSGTVELRDSCWYSDFITMLNQHLPAVGINNSVTLTGGDIPNWLKDQYYSKIGANLDYIDLKYNNNTQEYHIWLHSVANKGCIFTFAVSLTNNVLKPISSVYSTNYVNQNPMIATLEFTDGTNTNVTINSTCSFAACPDPVLPDTCVTLSPFTNELFSFLAILKNPDTPRSGTYNNDEESQQLDHLMDPYTPMQYSLDQTNCTLTLTSNVSQSGGVPTGTSTRNLSARLPANADKTRIKLSKVPLTRIPSPCKITFSNCDWMSSDATLISIKPYFSNGITNAVTDEFIITYYKGSKPDTLTVIGKSDCFPINECHDPYFCSTDTLQAVPPNNYNACVESKINTATYIAYSNYEKWIDSLKTDLLTKYYAKCMQAIESMSYNYTDKQFHYTLYYYDQAGNLVRTVPPAGVHLLSPALSTQIDSDRNAHITNGTTGITAHTLVTNYAYNSLNQNTWQLTPDAGRTDFLYDKLGRIAASQNAKQKLNNDYSYSWYDKLGRIVESGKIHLGGQLNSNAVLDYNNWKTYLYGITDRTEITFTQYDELFSSAISAKFGSVGQQNLRGRVASIMSFKDKAAQTAGKYRHATHYTYDVTGNVPIVLQDYPSTPIGTKAIAYNFDLLTGKVNEVRYEPGLKDEFRHKYTYDDELRLMKVQTSTKGIVWETEAEYFYYKHGPLARTELGQLKVQGLDYIYTLQGWIKGVNGTTQTRNQDAGGDGIALNDPKQITTQINGQPVITKVETDPNYNSTGSGYHSLHSTVAADAFGYVLGYYKGDYSPIDPGLSTTVTMDAGSVGDVKPLYNGNISRMYTWLQGQNMGGLGMNYRYDQLNRLKSQQAFTIAGTGGQSLLANGAYGMRLSYDPNGNIMQLDRNGRPMNEAMDKLGYKYYINSNKLEYVKDAVSGSNYPENNPTNGTATDIDAQAPGNYTYDAIGNLIKDNIEGISSINWNLQNKITGITKTGAQINFAYDASGNRVYKKYYSGGTTTETYYVRDATGNILSTYEMRNDTLFWNEQNLYGSSRLGIWHPEKNIEVPGQGLTNAIDWQNVKPHTTAVIEDSTIRGSKQYELTNHLGNVLATISDHKMQSTYTLYGTSGITADLLTASDYYAFGMQMPGRNFNSNSYRYGFNSMEKDNEIKGSGNHYTTYWRQYDPRIGRWISPDPLMKRIVSWSPYSFAFNNPINLIDIYGNAPGDEKGMERADKAKTVDKSDTRSYKQVNGDASIGDNYVDCSELCREIAQGQGYDPGRDSRKQAQYYKDNGEYSPDVKDVQLGDFVFFKKSSEIDISHTGIVTKVNIDGSFNLVHATYNKKRPGSIKENTTSSSGTVWPGLKDAKEFVGTGRPKQTLSDAGTVQAEAQSQDIHQEAKVIVPNSTTGTNTSAGTPAAAKPATSSGSPASVWWSGVENDWNQFWSDFLIEVNNLYNWTGK